MNTPTKEAVLADLWKFIGRRPVINGIPFRFYDEDEPSESGTKPLPPIRSPNFIGLLEKAKKGDAAALKRYASNVRALCHELELLERNAPALVKSVACEFSDWPVVASLHGMRAGKIGGEIGELLTRLDVGGDKAPLPAYSGQKYDPQNLWTQYAINAHACLRSNRQYMPPLLEACKTAKDAIRVQWQHLNTTHETFWYKVGKKVVFVTDWQKLCVDLPQRLTRANATKFMALAKFAIREFWYEHPGHFAKVKEKTSTLVRSNTDAEHADRAFSKILQAFKGIAHK
jgi:hypothetical protein